MPQDVQSPPIRSLPEQLRRAAVGQLGPAGVGVEVSRASWTRAARPVRNTGYVPTRIEARSRAVRVCQVISSTAPPLRRTWRGDLAGPDRREPDSVGRVRGGVNASVAVTP